MTSIKNIKKHRGQVLAHGSVNTKVPDVQPHKERDYITNSIDYIPFGSDNLFPQAVASLNRKSAVNRGILRNKKKYVIGKKIHCDEKNIKLKSFIDSCNANDESLRDVLKKYISDFFDFGNAFIEIVTNRKRNYLNIYHRDATTCRVASNKKEIIIHPDWFRYSGSKDKAVKIAIYPEFTEIDGKLHSIVHKKDYEPEFNHYGVMEWIAGLGISAIAYKTDKWNISRLDNSFKSSGVLIVDGNFESKEDAEDLKKEFRKEFTGEGNTGKVLFIAKQLGGDGTQFVQLKQDDDGDWTQLHKQSSDDLIVAHGWYRTLSGLPTSTGFDTNTILNEYSVALSTTILEFQDSLKSEIAKILKIQLGIDTDDLEFINEAPIIEKPNYMRIWEARKLDGLEYDENDPEQQKYLAELGKNKK